MLPAAAHYAYAAGLVPLEYLALVVLGIIYFVGRLKALAPVKGTPSPGFRNLLREAYGPNPVHRHAPRLLAFMAGIYYVLIPATLWVWQFELTGRYRPGTWYIVNAAIQVAAGTAYLLWLSLRQSFRPVFAAIALVYVLSQVLQFFAYIYWTYGDAPDFGHNLSHLDAFYFAVGTLTTAGTGSLNAVSQTARLLQTVQMGLDFGLVIVAVGFVLARYSQFFQDRTRQRPPDQVASSTASPVAQDSAP